MDFSIARLKKGSATHALLALVTLSQIACTDEMRWKEQVFLHDGSFLEVERYATRRSIGFPNSRRGPILMEKLRYPKLGVEWRDEGREELVSFDIVDGTPYLVSVLFVNRERYCKGKPSGEYIANYYRWIGGRQEKIARAQTPIGIMRLNLTGFSHWGSNRREDPAYLSWRDVMWRTGQSGVPELLGKFFADDSFLRCS